MAEGWQPDEPEDADGVHPVLLALAFAAVYSLLCGGYIVLSGRVAARAAADVTELAQIELLKGLGFVAATALVFFGFAWLLLRRLASRQRLLLLQRRALLAAERRVLTGTFCAAVAHDINNVLTVATGQVELLGVDAPPERRAAALAAVRGALGQLTALAKRMVALARSPGQERREPVDLVRTAREAVDFARRHPLVRGCQLTVSAVRPLVVRGNAAELGRVVLNLVLNAADATGGKGRIDVRVLGEGAKARLEVHDDGPGVAPALREQLFDGFVTTKPDGSGLGLLSVRVTVSEHGGSVALGDSDLGGACFSVTLPAEPSPS